MQVKHKSLYSINIDYKRICTFFLFAEMTKNKIFPVQPKYTSCLPACFVNPFILRILVVNFCATFSGNFTVFIIYNFVLLHPEFYRENFQFYIKKEHRSQICTASMLCIKYFFNLFIVPLYWSSNLPIHGLDLLRAYHGLL